MCTNALITPLPNNFKGAITGAVLELRNNCSATISLFLHNLKIK